MRAKIIDEKIDDLAILCSHWAGNRLKGFTPIHIRSAIIQAAKELTELDVPEVKMVQGDVVEVKG